MIWSLRSSIPSFVSMAHILDMLRSELFKQFLGIQTRHLTICTE